MQYKFTISGHKNVTGTHPTTLEFTKDSVLTENGDCIIGVAATFDAKKLREFANCEKISLTIKAGNCSETITAKPNKDFNDDKEIVLRIGVHESPRTFATDADKAAKHISREIITWLKNPQNRATIEVSCDEH